MKALDFLYLDLWKGPLWTFLVYFNKTFHFYIQNFNFFWENIHPVSIRVIHKCNLFFAAFFSAKCILSSIFFSL